MDPLGAARAQMAFSLGFHMIFAALGIGLPLFMVLAEGLYLRTKRPEYLALARKWAKATGLLFAVGAVSGTALSFELGLLWPRFMEFAGPLIGPAFALEGYAFFIEAIFLGLYLYGWDRLKPVHHWLCGVPVAVSGAVSGILVVSANAWMQNPVGFELAGGKAVNIDPMAALFNPTWAVMAVHSTLSCYMASAFSIASVYAWGYLKGRRTDYQRAALRLAMTVGALVAFIMPFSGHFSAGHVAHRQPAKLAAMEAHFRTERGAALKIGGLPDTTRQEVPYALEIPFGLSLLAHHDPHAEVKGLEEIPRDQWPNVPLVHGAFQVMIGSGFALMGLSALYWAIFRKRRGELPDWVMRLLVPTGVMAFAALEAGWIVSEVGRQPWTIYGIMRTREAVTTAPYVEVTFFGFLALYTVLAVALGWLLLRLAGIEESGPANESGEKRPGEPERTGGREAHAPAHG